MSRSSEAKDIDAARRAHNTSIGAVRRVPRFRCENSPAQISRFITAPSAGRPRCAAMRSVTGPVPGGTNASMNSSCEVFGRHPTLGLVEQPEPRDRGQRLAPPRVAQRAAEHRVDAFDAVGRDVRGGVAVRVNLEPADARNVVRRRVSEQLLGRHIDERPSSMKRAGLRAAASTPRGLQENL
jgi:hypothetical protein